MKDGKYIANLITDKFDHCKGLSDDELDDIISFHKVLVDFLKNRGEFLGLATNFFILQLEEFIRCKSMRKEV